MEAAELLMNASEISRPYSCSFSVSAIAATAVEDPLERSDRSVLDVMIANEIDALRAR